MAERHDEMTVKASVLRQVPAVSALALIAGAVLGGLLPVLVLGLGAGGFHADSYLFRIARFTLLQAALSTLLSLALGVPVARALARRRFWGRTVLVRLLSLPLALPAIVAVLGIVDIFGGHGVLGGWFDLYGLTGILIAHVFFNFPMVARMALNRLEDLPPENFRLAAQLGFSDWDVWRHVEAPRLLPLLPGLMLLIFLLCAASFTVVLTLGGGPQATTLEVAIYQALRFDFDPVRATMLALVQAAICGALAVAAQRYAAEAPSWPALRRGLVRYDGRTAAARWSDVVVLVLAVALLLPPLLAVLADGVPNLSLTSGLIRAIGTSLAVSGCAAALAFLLCWPLARRSATSTGWRRAAGAAVLAALLLPPAVIATGWFIVMSRFADVTGLAPLLVVVMNALMALPFCFAVLSPAFAQAAAVNDRLCASLGIAGWVRFRLIDLPVLRRPIGLALVMSAIVALGDLTAIMLFGSENFTTLPALIYRQMGSYRITSASGTALVLAALAMALVALTDRWSRRDA